MPRVSIIIPTYNYGRFIEESLNSVFAQDYTDYEVIVVDDGSTDDTTRILKHYTDRIRYLRIDHAGVAAARNAGISISDGELIAFQDADDLWMPDSLRRRVDMLDDLPDIGMVFADVRVEKNGEVLFPSFLAERKVLQRVDVTREKNDRYVFRCSVFSDLLCERFITIPTLLIRRSSLEQVGPWNPDVEGVEDYEFYLRAAKQLRSGYIDRVLAVCRIHGENVSCNLQLQNLRRIDMLRRFLFDDDLTVKDRGNLRKRLSVLHSEVAWFYKQDGNYQQARNQYLLAWQMDHLALNALAKFVALAIGRRG